MVSEYNPVERFQKWLSANVKDPIPMDDKSRLHEYFDILSSQDSPIMYKDFALKGLGMLSIKYSSEPIILCGIIPLIKIQLTSPYPPLVAQSIRTLTFLSDHGGQKELLNEKIHITVRNLVSDKSTPKYIKEIGLKFYFKMLDGPLEQNF
jgi:hypothetical protein